MKLAALLLAVFLLFGCSNVNPPILPPSPQQGNNLGLSLPHGFSISVFADVPGARSMALGENGTLFVGTRGDKVYAVRDGDGDGKGERVVAIASGLSMPNGVAYRDGSLYVAEISRVLKFEGIEGKLDGARFEVVSDDFPDDEHHGWKFIAFGPDGKLYVPVGAPCNSCDRQGYAAIYRMNTDGSGKELFAEGVRNTVGVDWQPETEVMHFTDNGRDWLGDNAPPDELNRAPSAGMDFGFPYCHAGRIPDPELGEGEGCENYEPPALELGPHVAALGMEFYKGEMFPEGYRGAIFIAEHGSWNREEKIGYRVMVTRIGEDGRAEGYLPFAEGWLKNGEVSGRPVDVLVMPDGSLLVSDDHAGKIYRVTYGG